MHEQEIIQGLRNRNNEMFLLLVDSYKKKIISLCYSYKNYVRDCINDLPEELKMSIVLYYYLGLSQSEIGTILKVSQKAIEGRIYRAKHKLKIEFEKEGYLLCKNEEMI